MFYFCKMQATGNDFVLVDYTKEKFEYSFKLLAEFLCDRHYGVGADGLIILDKSEVADLKMRIFNKDGSEAEMCGNGIRCLAKYAYEHDLIKKEKFLIETMAGIKSVELIIEGKNVLKVKVEMEEPVFEYNKVPVVYNFEEKFLAEKNESSVDYLENKSEVWKKGIDIDGKTYYSVSLGNPHTVCFVENLEYMNIEEIGKKVENYKYFPNKTNVEFVELVENNRIKVRIWERGVGETLSCGTGSCAAAIISHIMKSTDCDIIVDLKGGILNVSYDKENEKIYLEGEAKEVFTGILNI